MQSYFSSIVSKPHHCSPTQRPNTRLFSLFSALCFLIGMIGPLSSAHAAERPATLEDAPDDALADIDPSDIRHVEVLRSFTLPGDRFEAADATLSWVALQLATPTGIQNRSGIMLSVGARNAFSPPMIAQMVLAAMLWIDIRPFLVPVITEHEDGTVTVIYVWPS